MSNFLTLVKFEYIKIFKSKFNMIFIIALFGLMFFLSYQDIKSVSYYEMTADGLEITEGVDAIKIYNDIAKSGTGEVNEEYLGKLYDDMQNDGNKGSKNNSKYGAFYELYYHIMSNHTVHAEGESEKEQDQVSLNALSREEFINVFNDEFKEYYKETLAFQKLKNQIKTEYFENQIDEIKTPINNGFTNGYTFFFNKQQVFAVFILLLISILSANIFSREYSLKTDAILISTKKGKKILSLAKITAIFSLSVLIYFIITLMHLVTAQVVYGLCDINTPYFLSTLFLHSTNPTPVVNVFIIKILISVLVCLAFSVFGAMLSQLIKNQLATITILLIFVLLPVIIESVISVDLTSFQKNILGLFPAFAQYDDKLFGYNIYLIKDIVFSPVTVISILYSSLAVIFTIITHISFKKHQVS